MEKEKRVRRKDRKAIEDLVVSYWKDKTYNPTVEEVFNEWNHKRLEDLKRIAPGTLERYTQTFNRHFDTFGKRKIKSITPEDIEDFLEEQVPRFNLTAKAYAGLKTITRGMLKYAKRKKLINFNVEEIFGDLDTSETSFKKVRKKDEEETFTDEEVQKILTYLVNNPDIRNLGILLMFLTGVRVGELVALKFTDICGRYINVQRTETRYRKGSSYVYEIKETPKTAAGDRDTSIPKDFLWVYKRLRSQNPFGEYIFMEKGNRFTTNVFRSKLSRICTKLNIPARSPHKIRKTYASIMFENGVDGKMIVKLMGHTNISCTENYYHRNRASKEQIADVIDSIPNFKIKAL